MLARRCSAAVLSQRLPSLFERSFFGSAAAANVVTQQKPKKKKRKSIVTRARRQEKVGKALPIVSDYAKIHIRGGFTGENNLNKLERFRKMSNLNIASFVGRHVGIATDIASKEIENGGLFPARAEWSKEGAEKHDNAPREIADSAFAKDKRVKFLALDRISRYLNMHIPSPVLGSLHTVSDLIDYLIIERNRLEVVAREMNVRLPENVRVLPDQGRKFKPAKNRFPNESETTA
jgi:hypothetical protein